MMKCIFLILFTVLIQNTQAQNTYSINGAVKGTKEGSLSGAIIFLDGTERKTYSDGNGEFKFDNLFPGTYQLVVHFVGFNSVKKNIIILDKTVNVKLALNSSIEILDEVVITGSESNKYLGAFLRNFLGDTRNGRSCQILNPEILKFSEKGSFVTAKTNDFLEIVNANLGYKIRYLLRDFRLNRLTGVTSFTGESVFENLQGTDVEKQIWNIERQAAYRGSFLHFLRSFYSNKTISEGFTSRFIQDQNRITERVSEMVDMEKLAIRNKKKLVKLKFLLPLYVEYDTLSRDNLLEGKLDTDPYTLLKKGRGSIIVPFLEYALIDSRGSMVDYRSFLIKRNWGTKRLGDQLPYEYMPNDLNKPQ